MRPLEFTINGITFRNYRNKYAGAGILYYQKLVEGELELFKNIICKVSTPPSTYFKNKKLARPLSKIIINYDKRRPDERTL